MSREATHDDPVLLGKGKIEVTVSLREDASLSRIVNKITGRTFRIESSGVSIRVANGAQRVHVPEWRFHPGSGEAVPPEQDKGFISGFGDPALRCDSWPTVSFLNQYPVGVVGYSTVLYPGFAWYRTEFELPESARGEPVELCLGGCDNQDWLEYWVYLNGSLVGHTCAREQWHPFPRYTLQPSDPLYASVRFGEMNLLAVQTRGLDRRFPEMHLPDAERYSVGSLLVEQSILIGSADRVVDDFRMREYSLNADRDVGELVILMESQSSPIELEVTYRVPPDEGVVYKQVLVRNRGAADVTLLEIELDRLAGDFDCTIGGMGSTCLIDGEIFLGVRHPAGVARGSGGSVSLGTYPGRTIPAGGSYQSKTVVIGVGDAGQAGRAFTDHLERHGHRKRELLNMYHCYGIHDIAGIDEPTDLTEEMLLSSLDDLERLAAMGVRFDYYFVDAGWSNPDGDMRDFDRRFFPEGPGRLLRRIEGMGMKLGLWTSPASGPMAFHPGVAKPELAGCGTMPSIDPNAAAHRGALCLASEPWKSMFRDALLYHVRENHAFGFKFDGVGLVCSNPAHGHMLGLYSIEAVMDATIEILEAVRRECPDVFLMYYWEVRSPWWLLWGNTIYERGVLMEGSTPADAPSPLLRQSVTISFDQATHHAWDRVPLVSGDSLGVWISRWRWASYMGREGWRDAWIMDIARGSMMCQLWGDLSMLNGDDREFLARVSAWVKERPHLLRSPQRILGSPWDAEPYGYAYSDSQHGIAFIHNPTFDSRNVGVTLAGRSIDAALHPFEVKIIEVSDSCVSEFALGRDEGYVGTTIELPVTMREVARTPMRWSDPEEAHFLRRVINGRSGYADQQDAFGPADAEPADERDSQVVRRTLTGKIPLPPMPDTCAMLLICQADREGVYWHHHALYDIILPRVVLDGSLLGFRSTPHRWHEEAGGWSWILFEASVGACSSTRTASLEVTAYLPDGVNLSVSARISHDGSSDKLGAAG